MPIERDVPVWAAELTLAGGVPVVFVLGRPEVQHVGGRPLELAGRFVAAAEAQWFQAGEVLPLLEAFPDVEVETLLLELDLPEKRGHHPELHLAFHALVARPAGSPAEGGREDGAPAAGVEKTAETPSVFAWLPALGVSAVAADPDALRAALRRRVIAELGFQKLLDDGAALFALQAPTGLTAIGQDHRVTLHTFSEIRELARANQEKLLPRVATPLPSAPGWSHLRQGHPPGAIGMEAELDALTRAAEGRFGRSVVLVGPSGVGKSELVRALAARGRLGHPVHDTTAARLIRELTTVGGWQEPLTRLVAEIGARQDWLYVRRLAELFEVGRYVGNRVSVGEYLRPHVHSGALRLISECTSEEKAAIDARYPGWLDGVALVAVPEPASRLGEIVRAWAESRAPGFVQITPDAVDEALRLGRRFSPYAGFPGRAIRTLDAAARSLASRVRAPLAETPETPETPDTPETPPPRPTRALDVPSGSADPTEGERALDADALAGPDGARAMASRFAALTGTVARELLLDRDGVIERFTAESGVPRWLVDPAIPMPHAEVRAFFEARVYGQPEAVAAAVDAIATMKADVARRGRPVASLLLVGPTGVGKTETARALASFLFGSSDRLTRFDMSEYADPGAVLRLVGHADAEGAGYVDGLLTGAARRQPFGVLLFDEVEKAHPGFLDLLLQVLGEGRLSDASGRVADFCASVVVLTSNIGASGALRPSSGFGREERALTDHFRRAVLGWLRPELYNRIDRVIAFSPLGPDAVGRVLDRELAALARRPGLAGQRLDLSAEVREALVQAGFQPAFGARPLQRALQDALVAPLAAALDGWRGSEPPRVVVERVARAEPSEGSTAALRVRLVPATEPRPERTGSSGPFTGARALRRLARDLREGSACVSLDQQVRARHRRAPDHVRAADPAARLLARLDAAVADAWAAEADAGLAFLDPHEPGVEEKALDALWEELDTIAQALVGLAGEVPDRVIFAVWGVYEEGRAQVVEEVLALLPALRLQADVEHLWLLDTCRAPPAPYSLAPPGIVPKDAVTRVGVELTVRGPGAALALGALDGVWAWRKGDTELGVIRTERIPWVAAPDVRRWPKDLERRYPYEAGRKLVSFQDGRVSDASLEEHEYKDGDPSVGNWRATWRRARRAEFFSQLRAAAIA